MCIENHFMCKPTPFYGLKRADAGYSLFPKVSLWKIASDGFTADAGREAMC
jgi:hypothetical protein